MLQIENINKKIKEKYGVEKAWNRFKSRLERGNKLTAKMYKKWAMRFLNWALKNGKNLEDSYTLYEWDDCLGEKKEREWLENQERGKWFGVRQKYSYSTRVIALTAGKAFISRALSVDSRKIDKVNDIAKKIEEEEKKLTKDKILDEVEIKNVIDDCESCINPNCEIIAKLGFNLVLRAADLVKITPQDINLEEAKVHVTPAKGSVSRTHRLISMPFMDKQVLSNSLSRVTSGDKYLFKNNCQDRPTASASIRVHFINQHNQSFHEFARHSAICWFIENYGFERAYLRARHTNYSMTTRYAEFTEVEPSEEIR